MNSTIYKSVKMMAGFLPHFLFCALKSKLVKPCAEARPSGLRRTFIEYLNENCPDFNFSVLDIGARYGLRSSGLGALVALKNLRIVGIEPDAIEASRLEASPTDGPYEKVFPVAVWDEVGAGEIHITQCIGCTSRLEPDFQILKPYHIENWFSVSRRRRVEFTTLNRILDPNSRFDVIKIDVQGGEWEVMKGGEKYVDSSTAIVCETHFVPIYKGQAMFDRILCYFKGKRFRLIKLETNDIYDGEVVEADCVFIKEVASISSREDLLKQLLVCYAVSNWKYCELIMRNVGRSFLAEDEFTSILKALSIDLIVQEGIPEWGLGQFCLET